MDNTLLGVRRYHFSKTKQTKRKNEMNNSGGKGGVIAIIVAIVLLMGLIGSCGGGGSSSSSYQLHNKDGTINQQYYNDMQDYFNKHPEKRP